jgi:hypothetical protein
MPIISRGNHDSNQKRNLGFVKLRRGLKEHLHRSRMSSNASTLFVWLLLSARHSGPGRGCVEANYEDVMRNLGWTYSMVRRTLDELAEKGYIVVMPAANQHEVTTIRIPKYDIWEDDSAVSTGEQSKIADRSAVSGGVLSAVSIGEQSSEQSRPSISRKADELWAPKNAVEVKKEKNCCADSVRRPFDAELRHPSKIFSPKKRKQKLESRLIEKGFKNKSMFTGNLDEDERAAFAATGYTPRDPQKLHDGFVAAVEAMWDKFKDTEISQGNLCSKIIDYCQAQQESCVKLDAPAARSDYYWPPDFQDHRDRLRAQERVQEKSQCASVSA